MLKSLFCRSKRRLPDTKDLRESPLMLDLDQSDKEEDGFLLIGQTKKEQTAVSADNKNIDSPPGYADVMQRAPPGATPDTHHGYHGYLPGYEDATAALSHSSLVSQTPNLPSPAAAQESSYHHNHDDDDDDDDGDDKMCPGLSSSVLNGVMFKLSPVLNCQMTSYTDCQIDMTRGMSRLSQYQYDFHMEKSVIKWMNN